MVYSHCLISVKVSGNRGYSGRRLGKDISAAKLQMVLFNLGIDANVEKLSQSNKAMLRTIALLQQSGSAMGDFARTMDSPANQMRILNARIAEFSRAMGNLFMPMISAALPYIIAFVQVITEAVNALASLFGFELPKFDYSGLENAGTSIGGITDGLEDATTEAKKLKGMLAGFDELNIIQQKDTEKDMGGLDISGSLIPELDRLTKEYDEKFAKAIKQKTDEIVAYMKEKFSDIKDDVLAIGAAFLSWKVAEGVLSFIKYLDTLKGKDLTYNVGFTLIGIGGFLDAWNTMKEAIRDILDNGANFTNVTKLLSGFAEGIASAFLLFGKLDYAGVMFIVTGVLGITSTISDIAKNGLNWDNALDLVKYLGLFLGGLSLKFKSFKIGSLGFILSGVALLLQNLDGIINAIKTGNWDDVNKVEVFAGAFFVIGGLIIALKKIGDIKDIAGIGNATKSIQAVSTATQTIDNTISTGLSPRLKSLAKNLGLGLVIVAEVAAAALLITGAIIILGKELEQVGLAWQPVINNGEAIAIAMGLGVGVLSAIGAAAALLGSIGKPLIVNIALGTAILAELGIATGLFIIEIWAIGKGLDEIGKAWQPVIDNGETIAKGISIGTGLLVGIGAVTAALGAVTIASGLTLPLAIAAGTALLLGLSEAFILFTKELSKVANELSNNLSPALVDLNSKLPALSENMGNFVGFMTEFANHVVDYTKVSAIAGLSATIDTIIGWFTQDPIDKLANDVEKIYTQTFKLNEKLKISVPELKVAIDLLKQYKTFLSELEALTNTNISLSDGMFINMKEVGQNLVTGFVEGIQSKSADFISAGENLITGFSKGINKNVSLVHEQFKTLEESISESFNKFMEKFKKTYNADLKSLQSTLNSTMNSMKSNVSSSVSSMISSLDQLISKINSAVRKLEELGSLQKSYSRSGKTGTISVIDGYSSISYPKSKESFYARENGIPEMVSAVGSRSLPIQKNTETSKSIAEGVAEGNTVLAQALSRFAQQVVEEIKNNRPVAYIGDKDIFAAESRARSSYSAMVGVP